MSIDGVRHGHVLVLAACLLICSILIGAWLYVVREGVVSCVNFQRVQVGMPQERVEQLLGRPGEPVKLLKTDPYLIYEIDGEPIKVLDPDAPPDAYEILDRDCHSGIYLVGNPADNGYLWTQWRSQEEWFIVSFDAGGTVVDATDMSRRPPGFFQRVRHCLGS